MPLAVTPLAEGSAEQLPLYESRTLANATRIDGTRFRIVEGLDRERVRQLKERALDESDTELRKTSDYDRFGMGSYEDWYASKERTMFALLEERSGALAALAWFGPKPLGRKPRRHLSEEARAEDERTMDTDGWHTIVYRSYAPYRGKGLMTDFVRFTMDTYEKTHPGAKLWAGIFSHLPGSMELAKKLGFTISESLSDGDSNETILIKQ